MSRRRRSADSDASTWGGIVPEGERRRAARGRPTKHPSATGRPKKSRPACSYDLDAQLEEGIGETDGLAEVDEVAFVGLRFGDVYAPDPDVDLDREFAVVSELTGRELPELELEWMPKEWIDLRTLAERPLVVYCQPGTETESGGEDAAARLGRDAAECRAFAEQSLELAPSSHAVVGMSSQSAAAQHALATQESLPHVVLSDGRLELAEEMGLPTYEVDGMCLYERLTFVAWEGRVRKVFYPVADPESHAAEVAAWLQDHT